MITRTIEFNGSNKLIEVDDLSSRIAPKDCSNCEGDDLCMELTDNGEARVRCNTCGRCTDWFEDERDCEKCDDCKSHDCECSSHGEHLCEGCACVAGDCECSCCIDENRLDHAERCWNDEENISEEGSDKCDDCGSFSCSGECEPKEKSKPKPKKKPVAAAVKKAATKEVSDDAWENT